MTAAPTLIRAPGKLFWMGEYAVLEGGPALVAAVDREALIQVHPGGAGVRFQHGRKLYPLWDAQGKALPEPLPEALSLVRAVTQTLSDAGIVPPSMRLGADSSRLSQRLGRGQKLGLGSSGAVAAGLVAALTPASLGVARRLELALEAHRAFQSGVGSGADVIASSLGGLNEIAIGKEPQAVPLPEGLQWLALAVGEAANTRHLVAAYRAWRELESSSGQQVENLQHIARRGIDALRAQNVPGWLEAVQAYTAAEREMTAQGIPIITAAVERVLALATQAGWATKPSGAGGGDIVLAFAPSGADSLQLEELARRAKVTLLAPGISPSGAMIGSGVASA